MVISDHAALLVAAIVVAAGAARGRSARGCSPTRSSATSDAIRDGLEAVGARRARRADRDVGQR